MCNQFSCQGQEFLIVRLKRRQEVFRRRKQKQKKHHHHDQQHRRNWKKNSLVATWEKSKLKRKFILRRKNLQREVTGFRFGNVAILIHLAMLVPLNKVCENSTGNIRQHDGGKEPKLLWNRQTLHRGARNGLRTTTDTNFYHLTALI